MTNEKIDNKVKEAQEALNDQELDQVTGGGAEMPAKPETNNGPTKNMKWLRDWVREW